MRARTGLTAAISTSPLFPTAPVGGSVSRRPCLDRPHYRQRHRSPSETPAGWWCWGWWGGAVLIGIIVTESTQEEKQHHQLDVSDLISSPPNEPTNVVGESVGERRGATRSGGAGRGRERERARGRISGRIAVHAGEATDGMLNSFSRSMSVNATQLSHLLSRERCQYTHEGHPSL